MGKRDSGKIDRMASIKRQLHPNPQFARPDWISLDGTWDFSFEEIGQARSIDKIRWDRKIQVPFSPETPASGIDRRDLFAGCWYRRRFKAPPLANGRRLLLRFGAVDYFATVWVNGREVARHEGGYTPFHCDITEFLAGRGPQEVIVHAEDDPRDLTKPRGKQDWQPAAHSIWYPRTTGIWQSVWLEVVGRAWLEETQWEADLERFDLELYTRTAGSDEGLRLSVRLEAAGRLLAEDQFRFVDGEVRRRIGLSDPGIDDYRNELLWSPERPTLIEARLELLDQRDRVLDRLDTYTALRSSNVLGDRFVLNGRPRHLRLVLDQGYWPESGLTPPSDEAARRDVELAKEMGFNGIRAHQRIPDPRYLYWADRLGLLVWEEMPSPYRFSAKTVERMFQQWPAAIRRDRSHPCVIVWVPMNESWGVPDLPSNPAHRHMVRGLYHLTKALDRMRPVVGNDGWEMEVTDIISIHDYDPSPKRLARRYQDSREPQQILSIERPGHRVLLLDKSAYHGQPIMLTEFGGIALREEKGWGYAQADSPEELARKYKGLLDALHELPVLAGFCYTQFADTYQEANGLLRADRTPKFSIKQIRQATLGLSENRDGG